MNKYVLSFLAMFVGVTLFAQTTVNGTVTDTLTGDPIPGANVKVVGKSLGTISDFDGNYSLKVNIEPPFSVEVSMIGFSPAIIAITANNQNVSVSLTETETSLDEVVISASRTPERIMESPVTVERMDSRAIKNTSSPTFYDGLENLKGVDVNAGSLTFKSINTRGFATFANSRFMQLVDGMDNASPALNFSLGNLLGMNELDVNTVELLPGASSALYGANAFNGILFMTSKNPFDHQGASVYLKSGITSQAAAGDNQFYDVGARFAHRFGDKFAAKLSVGYLQGEEWWANDQRHTNSSGDLVDGVNRSAPNYNGLNTYGDEVSTILDFASIAQSLGVPASVAALMGSQEVSRTGYQEIDLIDYRAESVKFDGALHYRPFATDFEVIYNAKIGHGNTIYQGANRYSLQNFFMQQHKLELKNDNFFVRAYVTDEDAGDSYDTRFAAINVNRRWKGDTQWFTEYAQSYILGFLSEVGSGNLSPDTSILHNQARAASDIGRYAPGSGSFKQALEQVRADGSLETGAKFVDETKLYHVDANYNFGHLTDFAEIQVGASGRQYSLNSAGTIFTDYNGPIEYDEYGVYTQLQKKFSDDRLKFTGSIRYDKAQNFDGNFSPRLSLAYAAGEDKNHNFRGSFQTGFRNPTTQDQYIGLDVGNALLIGSAPDNLDRYTKTINLSATGPGALITGQPDVEFVGRMAYENSFTATSVQAFSQTGNPADLVKSNITLVKPEQVTALEAGYRGKVGKFAVDLSGYYNDYQDFISLSNVVTPLYGQSDLSDAVTLPGVGTIPVAMAALASGDFVGVQTYTNTAADVTSFGAAIGVETRLAGNYRLGMNYTYAKMDFDQASDPDFEPSFNTPEHKFKLSFGNPSLFENFGFNVNARWSDEYYWSSSFQDGLIDARTVVDAQVNYTVPKWKSIFKVGGANIGGKEYFSAPGAPAIGSQYFVSWTLNP